MSTDLHRPQRGVNTLGWLQSNFERLRGRRLIAGPGIQFTELGGDVIIRGAPAAPVAESSFGIKSKTIDEDTGTAKIVLYRGYINHMGSTNALVIETTLTDISGTTAAPAFLTLRINKTDGAIDIVDLDHNPPSDDGTYWNRVLYEVSIGADKAIDVFDRRLDWNMGSPL